MIKQISVFIENKPGRLVDFTTVMKKNDIDMRALCISDTTDFGILRCIVNEPQKAVDVLKKAGFTASITQVMAVELEDVVGGMHRVVETLALDGHDIAYVYSIIRSHDTHGILIVKTDDPEEAEQTLNKAGIRVFTQDEI